MTSSEARRVPPPADHLSPLDASLAGPHPHWQPMGKDHGPHEHVAAIDDLQLVYTREGRPQDPAVVLIMGLGGQLLSWPEDFCRGLLEAGYQVIRFDNRDAGRSTKFDTHGEPPLLRLAGASALGRPLQVPYQLTDMALDVLGLLDALQIESAHIVGISMGGMIAQILAAEAPARVLSLTSMMSTSGHPELPGPKLHLRLRMLRRRSPHPDQALRDSIRSLQLMGSPAYPRSQEELARILRPQIQRGFHPAGIKRQLAAILASGSRTGLLPAIQIPALIMHGDADPLIPVAAAHDLADRIPGARLDIIEGLGHDLPTLALPRILDTLLQHLHQADT